MLLLETLNILRYLFDYACAVKVEKTAKFAGSRETASRRILQKLFDDESIAIAYTPQDDLESCIHLVFQFSNNGVCPLFPDKGLSGNRTDWAKVALKFWNEDAPGLKSLYDNIPGKVDLDAYKAFATALSGSLPRYNGSRGKPEQSPVHVSPIAMVDSPPSKSNQQESPEPGVGNTGVIFSPLRGPANPYPVAEGTPAEILPTNLWPE